MPAGIELQANIPQLRTLQTKYLPGFQPVIASCVKNGILFHLQTAFKTLAGYKQRFLIVHVSLHFVAAVTADDLSDAGHFGPHRSLQRVIQDPEAAASGADLRRGGRNPLFDD